MKKFMKLILCCTLVSILSLAGISQVSALEDGASSRAIETYTRSTNIDLGVYGYTKVTISIRHNMTTGNSYISQITCQPFFNESYITLRTKSVSTNPALEKTFSGPINVKITYKYINNTTTYTAYGYIQL